MGLVVEEREGRVKKLSQREEICRLVMVVVASRYRLPVASLIAKNNRLRRVNEARHAAMYLAHTIFGLTQQEVADAFERDRTTVSYACHNVEDKRDEAGFDDVICFLELALSDFRELWGIA